MYNIYIKSVAKRILNHLPEREKTELLNAMTEIASAGAPLKSQKLTYTVGTKYETRIADNFRVTYSIDPASQHVVIHSLAALNISDRDKENFNRLAVSYMRLRQFIGICGILLPLLLIFLPAGRTTNFYCVEPSISDYFYTWKGDLFVVILSVLGTFLFTYTGYEKMEGFFTRTAGLCALGVAFIPTGCACDNCFHTIHSISSPISAYLDEKFHFGCAVTFFICISIMSLYYFRLGPKADKRTSDGKLTRKGIRDRLYLICGLVMAGCILVLFGYFFIKPFKEFCGSFPLVLAMESLAVWAFGISWLTKGEAILGDEKQLIVLPE